MVRVNQIKLSQVVSKKKSIRKAAKNKPCKLRKSLQPGTVAILLTGQFRGKRVVVLKQMDKSGLLLVTGPYKINGVPLRRVNQRFVIATSTKVALPSMDLKKYDDAYFKKSITAGRKGAEDYFEKQQRPETSKEKKADQAKIDAGLVTAISKDPVMKKYMRAKFALSNCQNAHELKF